MTRAPASPPAPPRALAELQGFLAGAFQREETVTSDPALVAACTAHVAGNERVTPAEQVDIYRRQFWMKHRGCLAEDYPGLLHILGDDSFDRFCRAYLVAHPPSAPSLRDLGQHLADFARRYDGFEPARAGIARDMVEYESSFVDVFDGADVPPLDPAKVAGIPEDAWSRARIVLHPRLVRLRLDHPVHRIRAKVKEGERPVVVLRSTGPVFLALYRKDLVVRYQTLRPEAFALLDLLASGVPLTPACGRLAATLDEAGAAALEASVAGWFRDWASAGWFVDVVVEPT